MKLKNRTYFLGILFFLTSFLCFSQEDKPEPLTWIKGYVLEGVRKDSLRGAHVLNLSSVKGMITDEKGFFQIPVNQGDTLMFSYVGYQSIKLKISNDLLKAQELTVSLYEKENVIEEVVVKSHNLVGVLEVDVKNIPKDKYNRIHIDGLQQTYEVGKPVPKRYNSIYHAVFNPLDFLYDKFGRKPKILRKLKKLKSKKDMRKLMSEKFDREVMLEYLQMSPKQLDDLLDKCNYSEYFIKTASDLQIVEAILDCYENQKALKEGEIKE